MGDMSELSMKLELHEGADFATQEDLLTQSANKNQQDIENNYLLTEMDSSRPESPSKGALNTSLGLTRPPRRKAGTLKSEALRSNEKSIRDEEND
jgi:hypothetical protein